MVAWRLSDEVWFKTAGLPLGSNAGMRWHTVSGLLQPCVGIVFRVGQDRRAALHAESHCLKPGNFEVRLLIPQCVS